MLTAERLRELTDYDPETGVFTWRERPAIEGETKKQAAVRGAWNAQWAGKAVRLIHSQPPGAKTSHFTIRILGKHYGAHRLAWLHVTGSWPKHQIDHRDNDGQNNRFDNLREATHGQNQCNKGVLRNNNLGIKGVHYRPHRLGKKKFYAQIKINGCVKFIGWYATGEEAGEAYRAKAAEVHGEFLHSSMKPRWTTPSLKEEVIDPYMARCEAR